MSQRGQRTSFSRSRESDDPVLVNGARGTREIEGKVTRVGASECGQRRSFKTERACDVSRVVATRSDGKLAASPTGLPDSFSLIRMIRRLEI